MSLREWLQFPLRAMDPASERLTGRLSERLWLQILTLIPEAQGYFKDSIRYDPVVSAVRFGIASRSCHRIASHQLIIAKARPLLDKKRQQDRRKREGRCGRDPRVMQLAMDGNLAAVTAELQRGADLESCGTWTEVQEKCSGYDKSWDWKNDTPLSMACSQGHLLVVQMLLDRRANPHHRVCNECDVHYDPLSIALQFGYLDCAADVKRAIHAEEEDKARKIREAALQLYHAAVDEASLKQEQEALAGRWQNRSGQFSLRRREGSCNELVYQEITGDLHLQGTLVRRCDGWWQGELSSSENCVGFQSDLATTVLPGYFRIRTSRAADRGDKAVHQIKDLPLENPIADLCGFRRREVWREAVRSSKLPDAISDEAAECLLQADLADRELKLEARREALRQERARERQAERERFRQEMRAMCPYDDDFSDFEEDCESELDDECDDDFDDEFGGEDDEGLDRDLRDDGSHADLLSKAAKHLHQGEGGSVDLARSAELCAMSLSLERDRPASECDPKYSAFGEAMATLRVLAAAGVLEALRALPEFARVDEDKAAERELTRVQAQAKQRVQEEERQAKFEEQLRRREGCKALRNLEVARCRSGRPVRTGDCTNSRMHNADFCTYRHPELQELPPHCLHFSQGNCRNGDGCWFNHLRCVCGSCDR